MPQWAESEKDRLQRMYPRFKFTFDDRGFARVAIAPNASINIASDEYGRLPWDAGSRLDHCHMTASIQHRLMKIYPYLYISVSSAHDGISLSVWVKRDDRDAEAMSLPNSDLDASDIHFNLFALNDQARRAKQDGWFYCTGHQRPEPKDEYGFFYFAARYCTRWGEEHPEVRTQAANERYN